MNKPEPFISIIIPVRDGDKTIKKCLDSLSNLEYKNFEIIVINDGSTDKTRQILSQYPFKIIDTEGIGPSRARNIGIKESRGDFIALTDADCIVDKFWLLELLNGFINSRVISVGGSQRSPSDDIDFGKKVQLFFSKTGFITDYGRTINQIREVNHNASCNTMYRIQAFAGIGFQEYLWPCEDLDLDYRLIRRGHKIMHNPKAIVYHYRPYNLMKFNAMMFRYGLNNGYLFKKYGFFRRSHIVPFLLILSVISIIFLYKVMLLQLFLALCLILFLFLFRDTLMLAISAFLFWNVGFLLGIFKKV